MFKARVTGRVIGRVIRALPGGEADAPGPSPPLADGAARTDRLASGYGHYRADHSKEQVIQKNRSFKRRARKRACSHRRDRGFAGNRQGVPGTRRGRAHQGQGDAKVKGTPRSRGRQTRFPPPPPHPPQGTRAAIRQLRFWRAAGKAGALPGRPGVRPPRENPSWLGVTLHEINISENRRSWLLVNERSIFDQRQMTKIVFPCPVLSTGFVNNSRVNRERWMRYI